MRLVRQKNSTTCGQACIAMILDCNIDLVISMLGDDITSEKDLEDALFLTHGELTFIEGVPKDCVTALQKHEEPNGNRGHWTILHRGTLLDPACIKGDLRPVKRHLVIES